MERGGLLVMNMLILIYLLIMTTLAAVGKITFVGYVMTILMTGVLTVIIEGVCLFLSNWKLYDNNGNVVFDIEEVMVAAFQGVLEFMNEEMGFTTNRSSNAQYTGAVLQDGDGPEL